MHFECLLSAIRGHSTTKFGRNSSANSSLDGCGSVKWSVVSNSYPHVMIAGGPGNPLGARAMYIGGTEYRIHGTNDPSSIGKHISSGCIRMTNDNVIDLYNRVSIGAKVIVLPIQLAHAGQQ